MTDEERQLIHWHLKRAQLADHKAMGDRYRVQPQPLADVTAPDFDNAGQALQWFRENRRNLVSLVGLAAQHGWHFEAWALPEAMWAYFTTGGQYEDAEHVYRIAAEAAAADERPDAQIRMMLLLDQTLTDATRFEEAEAALADTRALAEEYGDLVLIGTSLEFTGRLELKRDRPETALTWFQQAHENALLQVERGVGNARVVGLQLWFLAQSHQALTNLGHAARLFEEARDELARVKDWRTGVMVEIDAALLSQWAEVPGAAKRVEDALGLAHDIGITLPEAQGWHRFALQSDEHDRTERLEKALALYESIGDASADAIRKLLQ